MFSQLMSTLGFENVKIDTRLHHKTVQAGQAVQGEVVFRGVEQDKLVNALYLRLMTSVEVESGDHEFNQNMCLAEWKISESFRLAANKHYNIPFNIQLPYELPITQLECRFNKSKVWIDTHLDIDWALDAYDKDYLHVVPTPAMQAFITAMQHSGLILVQADVEKGYLNGGYFRSNIGCYQELEFSASNMLTVLRQVEVSFVPEAQQTHVVLEIDRGFARSDSYKVFTMQHHALDIGQLTQQIKATLGINSVF